MLSPCGFPWLPWPSPDNYLPLIDEFVGSSSRSSRWFFEVDGASLRLRASALNTTSRFGRGVQDPLDAPLPHSHLLVEHQFRFCVVASLTVPAILFFEPLKMLRRKLSIKLLGGLRRGRSVVSRSPRFKSGTTACAKDTVEHFVRSGRHQRYVDLGISPVQYLVVWRVRVVLQCAHVQVAPFFDCGPEQLAAFVVHSHNVVLCLSAPQRDLRFFTVEMRKFCKAFGSIMCPAPHLLEAFVMSLAASLGNDGSLSTAVMAACIPSILRRHRLRRILSCLRSFCTSRLRRSRLQLSQPVRDHVHLRSGSGTTQMYVRPFHGCSTRVHRYLKQDHPFDRLFQRPANATAALPKGFT